MEKKILVITCFLWAVFIFMVCYLSFIKISELKHPEEFKEKIDSLNSKIDSISIIKDSIYERIDTVYIRLKDNNKQYEKNFNRIINNDVNKDYKFFLDYINTNKIRFDSISNNL